MKSNVTQQRVPVPGDAGHWVHVVESPRHVRVIFNGETIADSKHAKLVREAEVLPVYYFPQEDVRTELLSPSQRRTNCPYKGEASYWSIAQGGKQAENASWSYQDHCPRQRQSAITLPSTGTEWTIGWRKMKRFLYMRAIRTNGSTFYPAHGTLESLSMDNSWRRLAGPGLFSKSITRCVITSRKRTYGWIYWFQARPNRVALIKDRQITGQLNWVSSNLKTWYGATWNRSLNVRKLKDCSASFTSAAPTSSLTARKSHGRRQNGRAS